MEQALVHGGAVHPRLEHARELGKCGDHRRTDVARRRHLDDSDQLRRRLVAEHVDKVLRENSGLLSSLPSMFVPSLSW